MKVQIEKIKDLIKQGMVKDALDTLVIDTNGSKFEIDSILMISRYNKMMNEKSRNLIDDDDEQREFNKIIVSTLEILDRVYFDFFQNVVEYYQLRFYETPFEKLTPLAERVYQVEFSSEKTRCVGWELYMRYPTLATTIDYATEWQITRPNGETLPKYSTATRLEIGWFDSWFTDAYGAKEFGVLTKGVYKINFFMGDKSVANGEFSIQ
jgi:Effector-associated domain 11